MQEKVLTSTHSVRLEEPTKLISVGTRTTYQATEDAGYKYDMFPDSNTHENVDNTA